MLISRAPCQGLLGSVDLIRPPFGTENGALTSRLRTCAQMRAFCPYLPELKLHKGFDMICLQIIGLDLDTRRGHLALQRWPELKWR